MSEQKTKADVASRRHLLKLGAMAAPAVITLVPASARAAASALNCRVPFPTNVDSNGNACSTPSSSRPDWAGGPGGNPANNGNGAGNGKGNGSGNQNQGQEEAICYSGPGAELAADEINNLQSIAAFNSQDGDTYERYQAYSKYLENVRANNLPGASCLMSIQLGQK